MPSANANTSSNEQQQQEQPLQSTPSSSLSKLQAVNYANIVAYLGNVLVTYGVGVSGYFPTNAELSAKYQTLVTPAGYAFAIWGLIFITQGLWTISQAALPNARSSDLVVKGVGYWYVAVCVAQCAWSICFAKEWLEASLAAMLSILVGLVVIVRRLTSFSSSSSSSSLQASGTRGRSLWTYWIFQFPFYIHCGWIWAASIVNINVVLVGRSLNAEMQLISAWISLAILAIVAAYYLLKTTGRIVYEIPFVLAWASFAIRNELQQPNELIVQTFDASTIHIVSSSALGLAIAVLIATVVFGFYQVYNGWKAASNNSGVRDQASSTRYSAMRN